MRPIDNVIHAVADARAERLDLSRLAVTAWHGATVARLDLAIARALGADNPETTVDDMIPGAIVGPVTDLVTEYTIDKRNLLDTEDMQRCEDEYIDLIRRVSESEHEEYFEHVRSKIRAAVRASVVARLRDLTLEEQLALKPIGESLSFVTEVADYYRDFKQQCGLIDFVDVLATDLNPIDACALCFIDRREIAPRAMQAVRRLLPRAFFCTVSADSRQRT